jgi:Ca2+-binding EF-hand superfamily protein
MRTSTFFITAALVAGLATSAFAQPPAGGRGPAQTPEERAAAFDKADVNKDGKLDKAEFKTTLPEAFQANADMAFDRRDANKDGFITKDEFTAAGGRRGPPA